ncbi:MAG: shikimate dehydrogenase [Paludibacteraceae bacterium]|nr:shikimate dehydrogenase [Paludibacteraceae bacterium]
MTHFGIIGNPLKQSFSASYFTEKFLRENINAEYTLYPLDNIEQFPGLIKQHNFRGLNVTIPYKQAVMPYLDSLDDTAKAIGAVNVILFKDNSLIGYNTDTLGFIEDIKPLIHPHHTKALVLGTGGAAKAVRYALTRLNIEVHLVSRSTGYDYTYSSIDKQTLQEHLLIVNCTPLGMYPDTDSCPDLPYQYLTPQHLCYDVIYNPAPTLFLRKAAAKGAVIQSGIGMLHGQAEEAWKIWNNI